MWSEYINSIFAQFSRNYGCIAKKIIRVKPYRNFTWIRAGCGITNWNTADCHTLPHLKIVSRKRPTDFTPEEVKYFFRPIEGRPKRWKRKRAKEIIGGREAASAKFVGGGKRTTRIAFESGTTRMRIGLRVSHIFHSRSAVELSARARSSWCVAPGKWINSSPANYARCLHRAHRRDKCADKRRVAIEGAQSCVIHMYGD